MSLLTYLLLTAVTVAGFMTSSLYLSVLGLAGFALSFLDSMRGREIPQSQAVKPPAKKVFLPISPEELEGPRPLLPDEIGRNLIPGYTGDMTSGFSPNMDPWGAAHAQTGFSPRDILPLPEYGNSNFLQRMFTGVPFLSRMVFEKIWD